MSFVDLWCKCFPFPADGGLTSCQVAVRLTFVLHRIKAGVFTRSCEEPLLLSAIRHFNRKQKGENNPCQIAIYSSSVLLTLFFVCFSTRKTRIAKGSMDCWPHCSSNICRAKCKLLGETTSILRGLAKYQVYIYILYVPIEYMSISIVLYIHNYIMLRYVYIYIHKIIIDHVSSCQIIQACLRAF